VFRSVKVKMAFESSRSLSVLSYAFVMVCIGVPVWWHTTDVVRFPLPFHDIEVINRTEIKQAVELVLVSSNTKDVKVPEDCVSDSSVYTFKMETRLPTKAESRVLSESKSLNQLDHGLNALGEEGPGAIGNAGRIFAYDTRLVETGGMHVTFGIHRAAFFSSSGQGSTCNLLKAVRETALGEREVEQMIQLIVAPQHSERERESGVRQWSQVKATPAPEYDVLLTLLNPEPHLNNVKWDMPAAIRDYLRPFLHQIETIYSFDVKSQVLYLTSLGLSATQLMTDTKSGKIGHAIRQEDLGLAINMESKLISHVSSKPSFNFLAYIPTEAQAPLHIKADEGTFLETNAFVVPRWGGVSIWNVAESSNRSITHQFDNRHFMSVVITQLRSLLGLKPRKDRTALADWEKDFLLRMRLFENLMTSRVTLNSLADLLSKISNIVITQEVAGKVQDAVTAYQKSLQCLSEGFVGPCFEHSKLSFQSSEEVFFDNSLLALLYFPEDQKYAIYVPLFLPILFSFVTVLIPVFKELREKIFPTKQKLS